MRKRAKVSLIATVLNESDNIKEFIKSILNQSVLPDEFIIVDGGSMDGTYEILKEYAKKYRWIKVFQVSGATIGKGRNYAIKKARNKIIVVSDGGVIYHRHWLKNLLRRFNGEVCFGVDLPLAKTKFQKILGRILCHRFKEGSSRNMIFSKKIWKEVGGYPEDLKVSEDTIFDEKIRRKGYKPCIIDNAISYWIMRKNEKEFEKQFFNYGFWDAIALKKYKMMTPKHLIAISFFIIISPALILMLIFSYPLMYPRLLFKKRIMYLKGFLGGLLGG